MTLTGKAKEDFDKLSVKDVTKDLLRQLVRVNDKKIKAL